MEMCVCVCVCEREEEVVCGYCRGGARFVCMFVFWVAMEVCVFVFACIYICFVCRLGAYVLQHGGTRDCVRVKAVCVCVCVCVSSHTSRPS